MPHRKTRATPLQLRGTPPTLIGILTVACLVTACNGVPIGRTPMSGGEDPSAAAGSSAQGSVGGGKADSKTDGAAGGCGGGAGGDRPSNNQAPHIAGLSPTYMLRAGEMLVLGLAFLDNDGDEISCVTISTGGTFKDQSRTKPGGSDVFNLTIPMSAAGKTFAVEVTAHDKFGPGQKATAQVQVIDPTKPYPYGQSQGGAAGNSGGGEEGGDGGQ